MDAMMENKFQPYCNPVKLEDSGDFSEARYMQIP